MGNDLWVLGREGLFVLDGTALKMAAIPPTTENRSKAPSGMLNCHFLEKKGMLWLGGEQGLWLFDPAAQHFDYTPLIPENDKGFLQHFLPFRGFEAGWPPLHH